MNYNKASYTLPASRMYLGSVFTALLFVGAGDGDVSAVLLDRQPAGSSGEPQARTVVQPASGDI